MTFRFDSNIRVGYYGAAVSRDLSGFRWQRAVPGPQDRFTYRFTYTFRDNGRFYFSHDMLYRPERLDGLLGRLGIRRDVLCRSKRGRDVPCFTLGGGEKHVFLTARQHACESTGSYLLEWIIRRFAEKPPEGFTVFCVPMVDYDGVTDGDQGKDRYPHDHNRDYDRTKEPVYPETAAIREYIDKHSVVFALDCHSPYHSGGEHDTVYLCRKDNDRFDKVAEFSRLLEHAVNSRTLPYRSENDVSSRNKAWMKDDTPDLMGYVMNARKEAVACSFETTYFGQPERRFSAGRAVELGRSAAAAIRRFLNEKEFR